MSNGRGSGPDTRADADADSDGDARGRWERRYRTLADVADGAVFELDPEGRFTAVDDALAEVTGYGHEMLEGAPAELLVDESDLSACEAAIRRCLDPEGPDSETVEVTVHPAEGGWMTARVRLEPIVVDGEFTGTVGLADELPALPDERPEFGESLSELFERFSDAFFAVDSEWRFTYVNERAEEVLDVDAPAMLGESVWEEFPEAVDSTFQEQYETAMETQQTVTFEEYFPPLESWFEVHAYPSETGLSVYFRDVTERKDREQTLERYRTLTQAVSDAIVTVDEDGVIRSTNPSVSDIFGYEPAELVGESLTILLPDEYVSAHRESFERYLETGERRLDWDYVELPGRHRDGHEVPLAVSFSEYDHEGERYFTGVLRDVSERVRYERALEELHDANQRFPHAESGEEIADLLVEAATDALDLPGAAVYGHDEVSEMLRPTAAAGPLEGPRGLSPVDASDANVVGRAFVTGETVAREDLAPLASHLYADANLRRVLFVPLGEHGVFVAGDHDAGSFADRTVELAELLAANAAAALDRLDREAELRVRVDQQSVVADLGERALATEDLDALFEAAVEAVSETLGTDYCKVLDLDTEASQLRLRAGVGWREGLVGEATVGTDLDSQAGYTLLAEGPVVVEDMASEERFHGPDLLLSHDVTSGISTVIGPVDDPWGILGAHDTDQRAFSEDDAAFVQSVANVLATAVERQERERTLRRAYEITGDAELTFGEQVDALLELGRETLGVDYGALSHARGEECVFERVAAPPDAGLEAGESVPLEETHCERAVAERETLVLEGVEGDGSTPLERDVSSYVGTPVVVDGEPYGAFCFYGTGPRTETLSEWEVMLVELLGGWVGTELERRRNTERLSTLDQLNAVVRDIAGAALHRSSREEVERLVCARLADTEPFAFAWIGALEDGSVVLREEAGVEDYLDDLDIALDDVETGRGPTAQAVRTQEIQVVRDAHTDEEYEAWHERAREYGFRASAAVPIAHEDTIYGVLNVYSRQEGGFGEHGREVLSHLGHTVGHALAAIERRRAFMGDESVEVEIRVTGVSDDALTPADDIHIDRVIPTGGDEFVCYGTAEASGLEDLRTFQAAYDAADRLEILEESADGVRFELGLVDPPITTAVAGNNGRIRDVTISEGAIDLVLELPVGDHVRPTVETIRESFPDAEVIAQRRSGAGDLERDRERPRPHPRSVLEEALTDRQRAVVEAAYFGGYFEWPREMDGEALADAMGVSPPTVHQHLRTAQRNLLDALVDSSEAE